jgi:hypothetical protein
MVGLLWKKSRLLINSASDFRSFQLNRCVYNLLQEIVYVYIPISKSSPKLNLDLNIDRKKLVKTKSERQRRGINTERIEGGSKNKNTKKR